MTGMTDPSAFTSRTRVDDVFAVHWSTDHKTTVICEINDGEASFVGTAHCSPEDTFEYGVGQTVALLRALSAFATDNLVLLDRCGLSPECVLTYHADGTTSRRMLNHLGAAVLAQDEG